MLCTGRPRCRCFWVAVQAVPQVSYAVRPFGVGGAGAIGS